MKKRICFILSMLLLVGALVGCAEKLPEGALQSDLHYGNRVKGVKMLHVTCWDNYIVYNADFGGIYNRTTGELQQRFCEDVECDGLCYLEDGPLYVYHVEDGQIYFIVRNRKDTYYCRKDILSGNVHVYFVLNDKEVVATRDMYVDNGMLYYPKKCLVDGGNPDDPEDYHLYAYRMDATGKKNEMIYKMRDNTEFLWFVDDGILYTQWEMKLYQIDPNTQERREFFDLLEHGFIGVGDAQFIDGKFYFSYSAQDWWVAAPNGRPFPSIKLVCIDVASGEWKYVTDVGLSNYCITNDAIYFIPFEILQRNDPAVYEPQGEDAQFCSCSPKLYACDLNGENVRPIWAEEETHTMLISEYTVVDQVLYGWVSFFDEEINGFGSRQFVEMHLDTGEILPAVVID